MKGSPRSGARKPPPPFTAEHRAHLRESRRGHVFSAETCAKIAASLKRVRGVSADVKTAHAAARMARWSAAHPGKSTEFVRAWRLANPEKARSSGRMWTQTRNARKRDAFIEKVDPSIVFDRDGGVCGICHQSVERNERWDIDHVIPLSKGGTHGYVNVQLAHATCNKRKAAKMPSVGAVAA
jgi:5-methylcytosine-specific restriction endonuclease McrA